MAFEQNILNQTLLKAYKEVKNVGKIDVYEHVSSERLEYLKSKHKNYLHTHFIEILALFQSS